MKSDLKTIDPTLTDDDIKVIKHLKSIDNLFKRGNLTISELFARCGTMCVIKRYDGDDYVIESFSNIVCDGGDPDSRGDSAIYDEFDWMRLIGRQ